MKRKQTTRKYQPAQLVYIQAKAAYEAACAAMDEVMRPHEHLLDTEQGIEEFCRLEEIEAKRLDRYDFAALLREAEQLLIDWSFEVVSNLPRYQAQAADLEKLRTTKSLKYRNMLIDAAMKLDPTL